MTVEQNNPVTQVNDKQGLLDAGGYDIYNVKLMQDVFPRIIKEVHKMYKAKGKKVPQIRDVIAFYFTLHAYTYKKDEMDSFFGACFQSYEGIMAHLKVDRKRIKWLADILEANGLIRRERRREGLRNRVLYFPSYAPRISDDGYLVDENGAKIVPNMEVYELTKPVAAPVLVKPTNDSAA
ncbi:hypothetical protein [Bacillus gaemokensis]|uniref:hypothetical protein n=2 Tax=Bacillus gaemokensis TaxID=574375 RepID=UPI00068C4CA1|nr:hypothetical protein [Bacillus gaemokensis]KYG37385.1 hypothetical protein AZF08_08245 [Bacillus gaemokensis]